jgi:hypothetical protein
MKLKDIVLLGLARQDERLPGLARFLRQLQHVAHEIVLVEPMHDDDDGVSQELGSTRSTPTRYDGSTTTSGSRPLVCVGTQGFPNRAARLCNCGKN